MATDMLPSSGTTPAAAAARTMRFLFDGPGKAVLLAEASEEAAAFLSALLANPVRASLQELLREDPAFAAAGCCGNLAAAEALLPLCAAASTSSSSTHAPPPPRAGKGIMAWRLFRCGHIRCRCSDPVSREAGSACPCASPSCRRAADGTQRRDTELHYLEACFYRRPDGSAVVSGRGGGRSGDTFYRCRARDEKRGRDMFPCRSRVTDELGVVCPMCHGRTSMEVKCVKPGPGNDDEKKGAPATSYAIMADLTVRPVPAGLSCAALLSVVGVAADADGVREETVPFGYEEGLELLLASQDAAQGRLPPRRRSSCPAPPPPPIMVAIP